MRLISNPLSDTSSNFNVSDEPSMQTKHDELVKKKQLITKNLNAEIESNSNVTYMIEQEKEKLLFLNEKLIEMKEKQRMIDAAKKELMKNENEALKKMKTGKTILSNLSSEVTRVKYLLHNQDNKINSLSDEINSKQVEIKRKKEEVKNLVKTLEIQTRNNKESLRKEMQNVKLMKDSKIAQERYCIKIILGLDLIKKYFSIYSVIY
jgi:chromosome segregation ATPase